MRSRWKLRSRFSQKQGVREKWQLSESKVTNFKTFAEETIELNNLNIVIGGNASGKSNLVQLFKFLRDIRTHGLINEISLQGGTEYLVNRNIGFEHPFSVEMVFESSFDSELIKEVVRLKFCRLCKEV